MEKKLDDYLKEAREELAEGEGNVNTGEEQKNPQPDGDPNKKKITNPEE